ncbi:hypothetical protein F4678DRAFT_463217 [Xylaria arbuscula]|nr:hypothetical protein F4678DRAFT_463217 [Xylaria arbuscula]
MHGKKHPAKASHSQSWGPWSDWKWDQSEGKYYAERFDWQGNVDYTWDTSTPVADDHHRTPRTEADIDRLTAGFGSLDVNPNYNQGVDYANAGGFSGSSSVPDVPASPRYTHDTPYEDHHSYPHSHRDKGKGISDTDSHDIHYDDGHSLHSSSIPSTSDSYTQQDYHEHSVYEPQNHGTANATLFSGGSAEDPSRPYYSQTGEHDGTDFELEQALKMSRDELLGNSRTGGSSSSGAHYDSGSIYPGTYELNSNIDPRDAETTPRGTPAPTQNDYPDTSIIRGTPGNVEPSDDRFVVEPSYKFQPGDVFKILWSEPTGQVAGDAPISDIRAINDPSGQFYNEPDLGFEPVPLDIYVEGETLAKESRVNYSKLVTIEHNVKVFFIGRIPYPYFDSVSLAVDKCWNDKMHKASKRSRR